MGKYPNFREFYQRRPIPIGKTDKTFIIKSNAQSEGGNFTHWLIALEGDEIDWKNIRWKMVIYPSEQSGWFDFSSPYYCSPFFPTFNEAQEYTRKIELLALDDQLFTINQ